MKLRKLLLCLMASVMISGMPALNTYAAEMTEDVISSLTDVVEDAKATEEPDNKNEKESEAEDKKENSKKKTASEKKSVKKAKAARTYTKAELRLLAALISCEAGSEPYAGKLAVGIVVVNRKDSNKFPDTIKNVIFQKHQFGPARNGSLTRALKRYDNGKFNSDSDKACLRAAKEALSGEKEVTYKGKDINMKNFLYFSGRVSGAKLRIANHQFK